MPIRMKFLNQKEVEMNIRGTTLRRSRTNRIVAGVCGGVQDLLGLDAFWFRLGFVLAMIPGGIPGIAVDLILWLIMPSESALWAWCFRWGRAPRVRGCGYNCHRGFCSCWRLR